MSSHVDTNAALALGIGKSTEHLLQVPGAQRNLMSSRCTRALNIAHAQGHSVQNQHAEKSEDIDHEWELVEGPSLSEESGSDAWFVTSDAGSAQGYIINNIRRQEVRRLDPKGNFGLTGCSRTWSRPEDRKDIARFNIIDLDIVLDLADKKDRNLLACLAIHVDWEHQAIALMIR